MTLPATLVALALLTQADAPPPEAAQPPPPAAAPTEPAPAAPAPASAPPSKPRRFSQDEVLRETERIKKLPADEQAEAMQKLNARLPATEELRAPSAAARPSKIPEVKDFASLSEAEQVKYSAREFFNDLIAGNAHGLVERSALPFQLEEHRIPTSDELFQEWLRNLRSKRTDLLTLYDIEVLTASEMEKKYGRPPNRLQAMPWRAPKTYIAVGNLSGHASVAVLRQHNSGLGWVVVGYHD